MNLGIIVLNYETWQSTLNCLRSIVNTIVDIEFVIYLVDNASPTKIPKEFQKFLRSHDNIVYIQNSINSGYNAGNNVGIKKAITQGHDQFLVVNNDIMFNDGDIFRMMKVLRNNSNIGIVGPRIRDNDGEFQEINMGLPTTLRNKYLYILRKTPIKYFIGNFLNRFIIKYTKDSDRLVEVNAVSGACFLVSKACITEIFPFDEYPFLYEEEVILGAVLEKTRFKVVVDTEIVVNHEHGASTGGLTAFTFTEFVRSELYYFRHYRNNSFTSLLPLYLLRLLTFIIKYRGDSKSDVTLLDYFKRVNMSLKKQINE